MLKSKKRQLKGTLHRIPVMYWTCLSIPTNPLTAYAIKYLTERWLGATTTTVPSSGSISVAWVCHRNPKAVGTVQDVARRSKCSCCVHVLWSSKCFNKIISNKWNEKLILIQILSVKLRLYYKWSNGYKKVCTVNTGTFLYIEYEIKELINLASSNTFPSFQSILNLVET